jgi:MFS family permease
MIGSACQLLLMPAFGALSDRMNRRRLYLYGTIAAAVWPFVFFPMISGGSFGLLVFGTVVALVIHAMLYGPQAALITEQFSPRLRYTGSSLAYTLAGVIGGAPAPLILTALLATFDSWWILGAYIMLTAVLTGIGLVLARDPVVESEEDTTMAEVIT